MRLITMQNVSGMSKHNGEFSYMILVFGNMKRFPSFETVFNVHLINLYSPRKACGNFCVLTED